MTASDASRKPILLIIAGPNGAGKTTFAMEYLPCEAGCRHFVNSDLIAAGLSPFDPDAALVRAGKIMVDEMQRHIDVGDDLAVETTLSGKTHVNVISDCRQRGYEVRLIFLSLCSSELALNRVRARVAQGGHDVADELVRRRFEAGARNFATIYRPLVDCWRHYDNSGEQPKLVDLSAPETGASESTCGDPKAALGRASLRAMEIGRRTKTPVWAAKNGMIVNLLADEQVRSAKENEDTTLP